jgi:hypothetical protein
MLRAATLIGIDDTDMPEEGGTGHVAREIARRLSADLQIVGVSRHQLLVDPRVPCTRRNSCKVVHVVDAIDDLAATAQAVGEMVLPLCVAGSDPGVCVGRAETCDHPFGRRVQAEIVTQDDARRAAREAGAVLVGLGGTRDGIIGAMAGVALAAGGNDGRFVLYGACRDARGRLSVAQLLALGIDGVVTRDGALVADGPVLVPERGLRPQIRGGRALVVVEAAEGGGWVVPEGGHHHGAGTGGGGRWSR